MHHILSLSIMQKQFPSSWKFAKVVPLLKKGSPLEAKNYRPVALLSPLSKVAEKVIYEQMYSYFHRNNIFHQNLHGYRHRRSTQTTLLQLYDKWIKAANKGYISGAVMLELSAAFDLVDHDLLVQKLKVYGLDDDFRDWIISYLSNRKQAVWINDS